MAETRGNLDKNMNIRMPNDLRDLLDELSDATGKPMNKIVLEAILYYYKNIWQKVMKKSKYEDREAKFNNARTIAMLGVSQQELLQDLENQGYIRRDESDGVVMSDAFGFEIRMPNTIIVPEGDNLAFYTRNDDTESDRD